MRVRLIGWGFVGLGILGILGLGWTIYTKQIRPYSTTKLSTIPQGVANDTTGSSTNTIATAQIPKTILITPIIKTAAVAAGFESPASFRLDIVDKDNQVIKDGTSVTVTLSSSSTTAKFDSTPAALIPSGRLSLDVKYTDTTSGRATLTAFVSGLVTGSADVTLTAGKPVGLGDITPALSNPPVGQTTNYRVNLLDSFGNAATGGQVVWTLLRDDNSSAVAASQSVPSESSGISRFSFTPQANMVGQKLTLTATFLSQKQILHMVPVP